MIYHLDKYDRLVLELEKIDRDELWETVDDHGLDSEEYERAVEDCLHETMCCDGPFQFISPAVCCDLTDAPMLAILGHEQDGFGYPDSLAPNHGIRTGASVTGGICEPVHGRWADMNYMVRTWQSAIWKGPIVW